MLRRLVSVIARFILCLGTSLTALADQLTLKHGERVSGQIVKSGKGKTRFMGTVEIRSWIVLSVILLLLSGTAVFVQAHLTAEVEVKTVPVRMTSVSDTKANASEVEAAFEAAGYIVAAHKIEVASRVAGKIAWVGVAKGDRVKQGQELARLEDDEYRVRVTEAEAALAVLKARLLQWQNGSRPEEIAKANADLAQMQAELDNTKVTLNRTRLLVKDGIQAQHMLDDA